MSKMKLSPMLGCRILSFVLVFTAIGCVSTQPIMKMPEHLPPIIKEYKHITLAGNHPDMVNTGIYLNKNELYSIFAAGSVDFWSQLSISTPPPDYPHHDVRPEHGWPFMARIGDGTWFCATGCLTNLKERGIYGGNGITRESCDAGNLYLGIRDGPADAQGIPLRPEWYQTNTGSFKVDIIVWSTDDRHRIAEHLQKMKEEDPDNKALDDALKIKIRCVAAPPKRKMPEDLPLEMPEDLPPIIKEYKHLTLIGNHPGMVNTGVYLNNDEAYSILATGSIDMMSGGIPGRFYRDVRPEDGFPFMVRIGKKSFMFHPFYGDYYGLNGTTMLAKTKGNLYLGVNNPPVDMYGNSLEAWRYDDNSGSFSVVIIVWKTDDPAQITEFFEKMKERYPENKAIVDALDQAERL